jgi:hypothetical protein
MGFFKLGSKVICWGKEVGEVYGYSCMPYTPVPYQYYIKFREGLVHLNPIDVADIAVLEYPTITSSEHKGELLLTEELLCPITHMPFINGQEIVQVHGTHLYSKEGLEKFWTIKGIPINPLTNLEVTV